MAITLVGSVGTASQGASGAAVTPAFGQTTTAGNLLIAWFAGQVTTAVNPPTPANPTGWLGVGYVVTNYSSVCVFIKRAVGSDTAPTFAAETSTVITAQLAEFKGALGNYNTSSQGGLIGGSSSTSPDTMTAPLIDSQPGSLVLSAFAPQYSAAATKTLTITGNNGQSPTTTSNATTSTANHYAFAYALTTANTAATSVTFTWTTTSVHGYTGTFQTFQPGLTLPSIHAMQAVNRSVTF